MSALLPREAGNRHNLHWLIVLIFALITAMTIARSLVHLFAPDGGANSVASIIIFGGNPDPNTVIYNIFALWGLSQLLIGCLYAIVLLRYRNLIPLMFLLLVAEYVMRMVVGYALKPMGEEYFAHTAPGEVGNWILAPLAAVMLVWSLCSRKPNRAFPRHRNTTSG